MIDLRIAPELKLTARRCYDCGRWYAFEERGVYVPCGTCGQKALGKAGLELQSMTRSNSALKGALTKAKRRARR